MLFKIYIFFLDILDLNSIGRVVSMADGVARASGLHGVLAGEIVTFNSSIEGLIFSGRKPSCSFKSSGCVYGGSTMLITSGVPVNTFNDASITSGYNFCDTHLFAIVLLIAILTIITFMICKDKITVIAGERWAFFSVGTICFTQIWGELIFNTSVHDITKPSQLMNKITEFGNTNNIQDIWSFFYKMGDSNSADVILMFLLLLLPFVFFVYSVFVCFCILFRPFVTGGANGGMAIAFWFLMMVFSIVTKLSSSLILLDRIFFSHFWQSLFIFVHRKLIHSSLVLPTIAFALIIVITILTNSQSTQIKTFLNSCILGYTFDRWINRVFGVLFSSSIYAVLVTYTQNMPFPFNQLHEWASFISLAILLYYCIPLFPIVTTILFDGVVISKMKPEFHPNNFKIRPLPIDMYKYPFGSPEQRLILSKWEASEKLRIKNLSVDKRKWVGKWIKGTAAVGSGTAWLEMNHPNSKLKPLIDKGIDSLHNLGSATIKTTDAIQDKREFKEWSVSESDVKKE